MVLMGAPGHIQPTMTTDPSQWLGDMDEDIETMCSVSEPSPESSVGSSSGSRPSPLKKKKGGGVQGKSIEEELCLICGDRASGYHYNALSCEGCKGFFRRSITRGANYVCKSGGNCEMDMWMRRRCQFCRLKRCREVGMKEECLLSDEQCKARDVRRKARAKLTKPAIKTEQESPQPSPDSVDKRDTDYDCQAPFLTQNPLEVIADDHRKLIESLVFYQDKYELPSEDDMSSFANLSADPSSLSDFTPETMSDLVFKQMAEACILVTQLTIEFAKHMPGFIALDRDDQICLLKGSAHEVMMLRASRRYDLDTDTLVFANGVPYSRNNMKFAGMDAFSYVDSLFDFSRTMCVMGVDNAEYALLTAICIFSDRPGLLYPKQIEEAQEMYINTLRTYIRVRRHPRRPHFAKLLMKLTDLRSLAAEHTLVLQALRVEKGSLPPLLTEYFDLSNKALQENS
eukprot:GHVU01228334.1.p1 GENE.GHVU01228334.1~~GHVU01228334.1.p1  ORF type:complete len:456 (+),score=48.10 GHVU01228334.1:322-1689(+)